MLAASRRRRSSSRRRAALADDPLNLLAVDAGANRSKGDSDAASWLPPNMRYRCAYVARQIAAKSKYHLSVTAAEAAQLGRQLAACPGRRTTRDVSHAPVVVDQNISDPGVVQSTAPAKSEGRGGPRGLVGSAVHFENCDAARAAGAAPVHRGDPGYGAHLDRDGDGTGCE